MKKLFAGRSADVRVQFFRYLFVGGSSAAIDLGLYTIFVQVFSVHYLLANVFAFCIAFVWNYVTSVLWIFKSKHSRKRELGSVFLIAASGMLITELLLFLQVEWIHLDAFSAKVIATVIVLFWNFGMRKLYVFD